jgi:hypothetical protein
VTVAADPAKTTSPAVDTLPAQPTEDIKLF